jgi:hypothetical protein
MSNHPFDRNSIPRLLGASSNPNRHRDDLLASALSTRYDLAWRLGERQREGGRGWSHEASSSRESATISNATGKRDRVVSGVSDRNPQPGLVRLLASQRTSSSDCFSLAERTRHPAV